MSYKLHKQILKVKKELFLFSMFFVLGAFSIQPENTEEYSLKAAFIYKFTNYIEWDKYLHGDQFIIGIIGNSPINSMLTEIAKTKTIKGKKIVVREYHTPDEIGSCDILFVSQKAEHPISEILSKVSSKGTLTISEKPGYAAAGTGINFVQAGNKVKFEANPKAIYSSGLTASSQLLKLAIIVN